MKLDKSIRREILYVAIGLAVGDGLICAAFALLNSFDYTVPLGALWGSAFALLNVWLLARRVQKVADWSEEEKKLARKQLNSSYFTRLMLMALAIVVGVIAPCFHYISTLLPFLIPQPVMMLRRAIVTSREKRNGRNSGVKEEDPE